jgi:hypothetical protein
MDQFCRLGARHRLGSSPLTIQVAWIVTTTHSLYARCVRQAPAPAACPRCLPWCLTGPCRWLRAMVIRIARIRKIRWHSVYSICIVVR